MVKLRLIENKTSNALEIELTRVPTIKEKIKIDDSFIFEVTHVLHLTSSSFDAELTVKKLADRQQQVAAPKLKRG